MFLFDEPLSNLDAKLRNQMRIEIRNLQRRLATTSLYVTHDQIEAMTMADRIFVLNAGRIEQIGTPSEIYRQPASTFVASFMGAPPMNLLDAQADGKGTVRVGEATFAAPESRASGKVTLGIRPEEVALAPAGTPFRLALVEELGASRLLHGTVAGQEFTVNAPNDDASLPETLFVDVPPSAVHVFDGATGQRT